MSKFINRRRAIRISTDFIRRFEPASGRKGTGFSLVFGGGIVRGAVAFF
jgi:hypothetical protein